MRGFTLIELLVVIGIMATLAAVMIPQLNNFSKYQSLQDATLELHSALRLAQSNATSGIKCSNGVPAVSWNVKFTSANNYQVTPQCSDSGLEQPKIVNPSFEDWDTASNKPYGWIVNSGTSRQSNVTAHLGEWSWMAQGSSSNPFSAQTNVSIDSGKIYNISAWVYPVYPLGGCADIKLNNSPLSANCENKWNRISVETPKASAVTIAISSKSTAYWDDLEIFEFSSMSSPTPKPYRINNPVVIESVNTSLGCQITTDNPAISFASISGNVTFSSDNLACVTKNADSMEIKLQASGQNKCINVTKNGVINVKEC